MPIPEFVLQSILDQILTFLVKKGQDFADDVSTKKQIKSAIQSAVERFETEYPDKNLSSTLINNVGFFTLPSVQAGIQDYLVHPLAESSSLKIRESLASLLPRRMRKVDAVEATRFFLILLRQELGNVVKIQGAIGLAVQEKMLQKLESIDNNIRPKIIDINDVEQKYLKYIVDTNQYIDPRGVMQTRRSVSLRLDQVYVSLSAQHEINVLDVDRYAREEHFESSDLPVDENENDILFEEVDYELEVINLSKAVKENSRLVILGDPGSGKTTLLRFLALTYAKAALNELEKVVDGDGNEYSNVLLPIFLRISNFADAFSKNRSLTLREYLLENFDGGGVDRIALSNLFSDVIGDGRALILLDGLDEIVDAGDRLEIGRRIEQFVVSCHWQTQVIVTSRIAGYREAPLAREDFTNSTFTICDMERSQIERFLQKWAPAAERSQTPDAIESEIEKRANIEVTGILNTIDKVPGIKRLGANPLMLTILALIHRAGARLPSRRVELYELAVKTLLEDWQLARGIPEKKIVREGEALRLLGPLAYWMHENKPDGLVTESELKEKLAESLGLARNISFESEEIEIAVEDFLRRVREHTGIFVERAPKKYGFMHLTFEEYFAARELIRRRSDAARRIYKYRHQARWNEPILLAIAFLSNDYPEDAADLISTAILAKGEVAAVQGFQPSPFEGVLNRDLLFAFQVVSDSFYSLDTSFTNRLAKELIEAYCSSSGKVSFFRNRIQHILYGVRENELAKRVSEIALEKLQEGSTLAKIRISDILGWLGVVDNPVILRNLLVLLKDDNVDVRLHGVSALGWLKFSDEVVVESLLNALTDVHFEVRWRAAFALGWLGVKDDYVIGRILRLLNDHHPYVRESAVQVLSQMGVLNNLIVEKLLFAFQNGNGKLRMRVIYALGKLGVIDKQVLIDGLLDTRWFVRSAAANVLRNLKILDDDIVLRFVDMAKSNDRQERRRAISALGHLRVQTGQVIDVLKNSLKSGDIGTRSDAAAALGWLRYVDEDILSGLILSLSDVHINVRQRAAEALGFLGVITPKVISGLVSAIKDEHPSVRAGAAASLERLRPAEDTVIASLVIALNDSNNDVSFHAASALGEIGIASDLVINGLCSLSSHGYAEVRGRAARSLAKIYRRDMNKIAPLTQNNIHTVLLQGINKDDNREKASFWQALWDVTSVVR